MFQLSLTSLLLLSVVLCFKESNCQQKADVNQTRILLLGGHVSASSIELYYPSNPAKNTILNTSMAVPRLGHASVVMPSGLVLSVGGLKPVGFNFTFLSSTEIFNPKSLKTHLNKNSMKRQRAYPGAAISQGMVQVCGGLVSGIYTRYITTDMCEQLNSAGEWQYTTAMTQARYSHGFAALSDGTLIAIGGRLDEYEYLKTVEKYNLKTKKWSFVQSLDKVRAEFGVAVLNGKVFIGGGNNGGQYLSSCLQYDPIKDRWMNIASLNHFRSDDEMVNFNGALYVLGGYTSLNTVEMYGKDRKWKTLSKKLFEQRNGASAVVLH